MALAQSYSSPASTNHPDAPAKPPREIAGIPLDPLGPARTIWQHRALIRRLGQREIEAIYRGTWLGICWFVIQPLLLLAVYTFVFAVVFKSRIGGADAGPATPALMIFTGLIIFNIFAETVNRAPRLLRSNRVYVKQVIFPVEILPITALTTALFQGILSFILLIGAYLIFEGIPPLALLSIPLILIPLLMLTLGFSWFLASIGVFVYDVAPFVGVVVRVLLFLCPIFYSLDAIGLPFRYFIMANPITSCVSLSRAALFAGTFPNLTHLALYWLVAAIVCWLGYTWFMKTRKAFGDVL